MTEKQINDAAAYIRSLAQLRGRNVEWGEKAVREAVSLSAEEALRSTSIDHVAPDVARAAGPGAGHAVSLSRRNRR